MKSGTAADQTKKKVCGSGLGWEVQSVRETGPERELNHPRQRRPALTFVKSSEWCLAPSESYICVYQIKILN